MDRPGLSGSGKPSQPGGWCPSELKRVTSKRLETTVQIGGRLVLLPVSSSALVISLLEAESAAGLIEQVEASVGGHSCG